MKHSLLGRREDEHLELKSRAALGKDLSGVAREVVALLNASGGQVWIGVREKDGVAVELEPFARGESAREVRRLRDHLVDTIEPSPGDEVEVAAEPVEGGELIRIGVKPKAERKPYAHVRQAARLYVTRVGDRLRPLRREEIAEAFRVGSRKALEAKDQAATFMEEDFQRALEQVAEHRATVYWLRFQPAAELELDFQALRDSGLLTDPERAGVGDLRASFLHAYVLGGHLPAPARSAWSGPGSHLTAGKEGGLFWLVVRRDGGLLFTAPLQNLGPIPYLSSPEVNLSPFDLFEYTTSVARLVSAMVREPSIWKQGSPGEASWSARLALFGLRGWILRRGHPLTMGFASASNPTVYQEDDLVVEPPLAFTAEELRDQPDRCAFRLVARVYEAFGYFDDAIPRQFDRTTGRYVGRQI